MAQLHEVTPRCGAELRKRGPGVTCMQPAGFGTDHVGYGRCKWHGGNTPSGKKSAAREVASAMAVLYGGEITIEPGEALLQEVRRSAGHVAYLQMVVQEFTDRKQLVGPVGSEGVNEQGIEYHPHVEPNVWLKLYQSERSHLAKVAKMAIDAGIAERAVAIAERQGELLAAAITAILGDLNLSPDQRRQAPAVVRRHLMALPTASGE